MALKKTGIVVATCGLALSSAAWAQKGAQPALKAVKPAPQINSSSNMIAESGFEDAIRVEPIMPVAIIQNGTRYPVTVSNSDVLTSVYSSGVVTQTGYFRSTSLPKRILDRASLVPGPGQGGPQTLTTVRTGVFTLAAPATPTGNIEIELEVFNDWNPGALAGIPVNTTPVGMVRVVFAPPTGTWAASTVYVMTAPVTIPTPIALTDTDFSVDIRCYEPGGSGNTGLSLNATPVLRDGGASIFAPAEAGYSDGLYYRDTNGDGIYGSTGERFFFANRFANATMAFEADPVVTGACCMPNGSCQQLTSAFCTTVNGVFTAGPCGACTQPSATFLTNAGLSTGPTSIQGPAPAGSTWAELQTEGGACANTLFGTSSNSAGPFRLADDFVLTGNSTINQIVLFPYVSPTGEHFISSPFTGATVRIWDGPPDDPGSTVVFGDTTTNRLASQMFVGIYRIGATFNSALVTPQQPVQTETLVHRIALNVNTSLPAGDYWIDFDVTLAPGINSFFPPAIAPGVRTVAGWNAKQQVGGVWAPVTDAGNPAGCGLGTVPLDLPFALLGTGGGGTCYANCDLSTGTPKLTGNDFVCFINAYANNLPYANCDQSTGTPLLTGNDFVCFINAYAQGCS